MRGCRAPKLVQFFPHICSFYAIVASGRASWASALWRARRRIASGFSAYGIEIEKTPEGALEFPDVSTLSM